MPSINLAEYPSPQIVEDLSHEKIFQEIVAHFLDQFPADPEVAADQNVAARDKVELLMSVEGNLITKQLQAYAYHAMQMRARVNDAAKGTMLAYAIGTDLDNLGAFYLAPRRENESDKEYRARLVLAIDGFSTAGPRGAYRFHAISAHPDIKDVEVQNHTPGPGDVTVTILSKIGSGVPDPAVLTAVDTALNIEDVRPVCDTVFVEAASVATYTVEATLYLYSNLDSGLVLEAARKAVEAYTDEVHRLGYDITLSGLYRALHQPGVQRAEITSPAGTIVRNSTQAAFCTDVLLTYGGVDV